MTRDRGCALGVIYELVVLTGFTRISPKGKDPEVDHRPARSLSRVYLRLENIKEDLDMIEEYVNSR